MDTFENSNKLDIELENIIDSIIHQKIDENSMLECKASALSWQKMMDNLVKTLSAFLNSHKEGCLLIGVHEDENKKLVISGLENNENKKDDQGNYTGKKSFLNKDDYEQNLTKYISDNLHEGAMRLSENIQIKFKAVEGKTVCALFVKPHFLGPNQIPVFAKIFERDKEKKKNQFHEKFFQRVGNNTQEISGVKLAIMTASRRVGELSEPEQVVRDNPDNNPIAVSDYYTLVDVNPSAKTANGKDCLEIKLQNGEMVRVMRRLATFNKHKEVADRAFSLLGKKVRTVTWGNEKNPPQFWEQKGYFNNIYAVNEKNVFRQIGLGY